jgi:site-specific DNA recombinase
MATLPQAQPQALVYCRVSTTRQAEEGMSLESQAEACVRLAESRGYAVARVTKEVYSGAELWDRPQLARDRADIKAGAFAALFVHATDRLSRDPVHLALIAQECSRVGCELVFVTEPLDASPEGQLIQYVKGYAAQVEREKIRERQLRNKLARARAGRIHNYGPDLYGYRRDKVAGVRTIYEPEAAIVRQVFAWIADKHAPIRTIVRRLNESGTPPPSAGKLTYPDPERRPRWRQTQIMRMVHNPAYKGESVAWRWRRMPGKTSVFPRPADEQVPLPEGVTPAIVSRETWDRAHLALASNRGDMTRNATRLYLLRGFVWCAVCGQRMFSTPENVGTTHEYRIYRCSSRDKPGGKCAGQRVRADKLEPWVWEHVARVLLNPETVASEQQRLREKGPDATLAGDLETARRELAKRERAQEKVLAAFAGAEEGIPADLVRREVARLEREKAGFAATISELQGRIAEQQIAAEDLASLAEYCQRVAYNLDTFDFEQKRLALRALRVRVVASGSDYALYGMLEWQADATGVVSTNVGTLWAPLAATSMARLTCSCPRTSARSWG